MLESNYNTFEEFQLALNAAEIERLEKVLQLLREIRLENVYEGTRVARHCVEDLLYEISGKRT